MPKLIRLQMTGLTCASQDKSDQFIPNELSEIDLPVTRALIKCIITW
jgi:hypothetical protein